jgi:hypothetical protein
MRKGTVPSAYGGLAAVQAHLQKADVTAAQRALKKLIEDLSAERTANNEEVYVLMRKFVKRVMSPRGKKTPEEVAILPAVVKLLLKK